MRSWCCCIFLQSMLWNQCWIQAKLARSLRLWCCHCRVTRTKVWQSVLQTWGTSSFPTQQVPCQMKHTTWPVLLLASLQSCSAAFSQASHATLRIGTLPFYICHLENNCSQIKNKLIYIYICVYISLPWEKKSKWIIWNLLSPLIITTSNALRKLT